MNIKYTCPTCGLVGVPEKIIDENFVDEFRCISCNQMLGEPLQRIIQDAGGAKAYYKQIRKLQKEDAKLKREEARAATAMKKDAEYQRLAPGRTVKLFKHALGGK